MSRTSLLGAAVCLLALSAHAWDGQRQGFLLGAGVGAGLYGYSLDTDPEQSMVPVTPVITSDLGWAWNDNNAILLHSVANGINSSRYGYLGLEYRFWGGSAEGQTNSWFGGLGLASSENTLRYDGEAAPASYGFALGGGYAREFARHFSFEIELLVVPSLDQQNYSYSSSAEEWQKSGDPISSARVALNFTLSALGY